MKSFRLGLLAALGLMTAFASAKADAVEDFYKGKTVTVLVGYGPGTGYDVYARTVARHLGNHIPGKPTVIVQNMPGAAGLNMMNHLYNKSERNGTVLAFPTRSLFTEPMFGNSKALYKPKEFKAIGNVTRDTALCLSWKHSKVKTAEQAQNMEMMIGSSAPTSTSTIYPKVSNAMVGTKFKIISGYKDSHAIGIAMERGELEGYCGYTLASIKSSHADWIEKNLVTIFLQLTVKPNPELKGVPSIIDLVKTTEERQVLNLVFGNLELGRPMISTPEVPTERVAALRKAFDATMADAAFKADSERTKITVDPMTGAEVEAFLDELLVASPSAVKKVVEMRGIKR